MSTNSNGEYKDHLYALIVAGGGGTRLWPKSRNKTPKQFLPLFHKQTLTQITAKRLNKIIPWEKIFVVTTTQGYKKEVLKEVPGMLPENIVVEPMRRDTAAAHGIGAAFIYKKDPNAVILNESADHLVELKTRYYKTLRAAAVAAYSGDWLVAVGIRPTYPNIGYGYIKRGEKWKICEGRTIYKLEKFTEKPKLKAAKKYLSSGKYYWNANQYVWRADSILTALKKHAPEIGKGLDKIFEAIDTKSLADTIKSVYQKMPKVSIDYAVSERAENFLLAVADYRWTDIGDWKEVWENLPKDHEGNVIIDGDEPGGEIINIDTSDAIIHKDGRLIAIVDVDNIIVVDTKDALLIASKSRAQNVKKVVNILRNQKRNELL